jgi:outer membrane protein assembly factor BamB
MAAQWIYQSARRPSPAWPEPGRMMHVLDFDYAFQPVAAGGLIYFGSSSDDSIYALDGKTGEVAWRSTTGGPVRFAPHIAKGRCYAAGDDGVLYCLDARTGTLIWKFRAAVDRRCVIGNDRMISRNPCRSGVLVAGGVAYVTAGMWPSEGVYAYALDAETGTVLWCNDTAALRYLRYPHAPSLAFGGTAPQGYLLYADDVLVVPCGKGLPDGFDAKNGALLYHTQGTSEGTDHNGGHWASIAGNCLFNTAPAWQPDQAPRLGEGRAVPGDGIGVYHLKTGKRYWPFNKSYRALYSAFKRIRGEAWIGLIGRHRLVCTGRALYAAGRGKIEALRLTAGDRVTQLWKIDHPQRVYSMALAGRTLLVGGPGTLGAYNAADGSLVWQGKTNGRVRGLAVADGRILAATEKGTLYSFAYGEKPVAAPQRILQSVTTQKRSASAAGIVQCIPDAGTMKGYALVAGEREPVFRQYYHRAPAGCPAPHAGDPASAGRSAGEPAFSPRRMGTGL